MMTEVARRHPENVAAVVNAVVTFFLPAILLLALSVVRSAALTDSNTSVTVHPERSLVAMAGEVLSTSASLTIPIVPFALIAGWRTRVHARRYRDRRGTG